ncbi:ATP-dependent helicase [Asanoa sp. WMMD1127]|uniref:UvrD-helicase domain-containing protein n=1 Tax=Asanoa sp. WMMD1127 TaxID=3016107 RepID=UPI002415C203|nr:ATP-dependent helicase [Asanoa sp. WMMD1127]MDG4824919.1 ATP-dependent helicase [Asanoa sp. WMMD1127]
MKRLYVSRVLASEIGRLNQEQRDAVLYDKSSAVLAGPGSGKTRLLVTKAAYVSETSVSAPGRVACITYGNQAADEIRLRLAKLAPGALRSGVVSTVHGFCLSEVIAPFSALSGYAPFVSGCVLNQRQELRLRGAAYDAVGLYQDPTWNRERDTACRRALFAGEDTSSLSVDVVAAAAKYDEMLVATNKLDFEAMVGRSLGILRSREKVRRILAARFPWILVDEYQDLGPVLHGIVTLLNEAGSRIFAVGDADQSIMGFTGSDPKHLIDFSRSVRCFTLSVNYRSGSAIVSAATRVLGEERGYSSGADIGDVKRLAYKTVRFGGPAGVIRASGLMALRTYRPIPPECRKLAA